MRLGGLTIAHAIVAVATLACVTLLGVTDSISQETLGYLFATIVGAVFGAAISQSAANGTIRQVAEVAIEKGNTTSEEIQEATKHK